MRISLFLLLLLSIASLQAQTIPYGYNDEAGAYFSVDKDTKLYFEAYGEGPPLLMLHGGVYGYIDEYGGLIPKLAEHYTVICLATRGHVKSDIGKAPFTYEQRAEDAYKLIEHLGLEKVTVIGFSDGGYAAYKLAALYPNVVEKMIVMGASDDPEKDRTPKLNYTTETLMGEYPDFFKKRQEHMPEPERWGESLSMLNDLYNQSIVSKETFEKITCPVMIMSGDTDEYSSPQNVLAAHNSIPNSQVSIIPGCGHVILFCNLPAVWESMKPFLAIK